MTMKLQKTLALVAVVAGFATVGARAQTNVISATATREGQVLVPEKLTATDSPITSPRPTRPERPALPPAVLERIERFRLDARKYLDQQEALKKRLQGANDQERAAIRDKMRDLREKWLERARELRKEYRERLQELSDKMPEYRELLDSIKSSATDQLKQAQPDSRPRPGVD